MANVHKRKKGKVSQNVTQEGPGLRARGDKLQGRQKFVTATDPFRRQLTDRNSSRGARREAEIADTAAVLARDNPVAFYTKFSKFSRDAATLPFALPVGEPFTVSEVAPIQTSVPGVMRLQFIPAIGVSTDFTSPINRSSIRFYTYLRANQKASASYDHQDITMMEVAMDSAYMFHAHLTRMYKVVRDFTPVNEYYSRALITAMGGIFDDLKKNLQDFRAYINTLAYNLGQYALPKGITMFERHRWMCEGLYTDGPTSKAQTYLFVPAGFWLYDNTVTTGSQCTFKEYLPAGNTPKQYTTAQLMEFGDVLLNAISNDSDFSVISGDIYNYYGGETFKLPYLNENDAILPSYQEVVLSQIENATIVGAIDRSSLVISQNPTVNAGAILFQPAITPSYYFYAQPFMNFHHDSPTPDDVIEASRLMAFVENNKVVACGTEIICQADIFGVNPDTKGFRSNQLANTILIAEGTTSQTRMVSMIFDLLMVAQFDWAPCIRFYFKNGDDPWKLVGWTWDIDNFSYVDRKYIEMIHRACLFSLFEVGDNGEDVVTQ